MASTLRLSEFCALIDDTLKNAFHERAWWILAEIKERNDKGGYIYFELVEKAADGTEIIARMNASVWRREAVAAFRNFEDVTGKRPEKGMQVLMKAGVSYHPVYGLSLQLFDIDSQHMLGQLELQRRNTIQRLTQKDGVRLVDGQLHTLNKEKRFPEVIQRIAILTSASAAGYHDFMHTLDDNPFGYRFSYTPYFSILQGEKAAEQMKQQLLAIYEDTKKGKPYDVVVIIRGGGAQSDLLPFDDFNLAYTVARFPLPVITGIGHLKDESITDMVAHTPVKTPTQAAAFIIDHNNAFEETVSSLRELIVLRTNGLLAKQQLKLNHTAAIVSNGTMQLLHTHGNRISRIRERISGSLQARLLSETQKLGELKRGLPSLVQRLVEKQTHRLDLFTERMKLLDPTHVLKRGYAMVVKDGKPVIAAKQVNAGDALKIVMQDGTIETNVVAKNIAPDEKRRET